jgi:hypothetical protein
VRQIEGAKGEGWSWCCDAGRQGVLLRLSWPLRIVWWGRGTKRAVSGLGRKGTGLLGDTAKVGPAAD